MLKKTLALLAMTALVACASKPAVQEEPAPAEVEASAKAADDTSAMAVEDAEAQKGEAATVEVAADGIYGAGIGDGEALMIATVLADPNTYADKEVVMEGQIRQVCQKMGCWFEMAESSEHSQAIRVKSPEHNIYIPMDSAGKTAVVKGTLMVREVTEAEAEHYRSEGAQAEAGMELSLALTGAFIK